MELCGRGRCDGKIGCREFEYNKEENAEEANLRIQRLGFSYEIEEQLMEIHPDDG